MKYFKHIIIVMSLLAFVFSSCEPRIELDEGQWGDHAIITNVLLFIIEEEEHELQEHYVNGETTTGIRRYFISSNSVIDLESATVVVEVPGDTDLTNVGLVIRHEAVKIEPLDDSPKAGYLDDFSLGPYTYRVISADGTKRDWTISFSLI